MRALFGLLLIGVVGCANPPAHEVQVFCSASRDVAQPLLDQFQEQTQIKVHTRYAEPPGSIELVNTLVSQREHPTTDVFWTDDVLHVLRLEQDGLLAAHIPPEAKEYPEACRSAEGRWHGSAALARVLVVNNQLAEDKRPQKLRDLTDPYLDGGVAFAKPLAGTSAVHAAALFSVMGELPAREFFRELRANHPLLLDSEEAVLRLVIAGQVVVGLADSDEAVQARDAGAPISIIYPDQENDGLGTLFIPHVVAIVEGAPHPAEARRLADFLLRAEIEGQLAHSPQALVPLHPAVAGQGPVYGPTEIKAMPVDFRAAYAAWPGALAFLREEFGLE